MELWICKINVLTAIRIFDFFNIFFLLGSIQNTLWISLFGGNVTIHPPWAINVLNTSTWSSVTRCRNCGCGWCGSSSWSWYRWSLHRCSSVITTRSQLQTRPWPLHRAYQSVTKILGEQAVDVECYRVIYDFQKIGESTKNLWVEKIEEVKLVRSNIGRIKARWNGWQRFRNE